MQALTNLNLNDKTDFEIVARRMKTWVENSQDIRVLLIIDNADNIDKHNQSRFRLT